MAQIALPQEPLEVPVAGLADAIAAQRRALVAVTLGIGFVALQAMLAINQSPCRNCLRLAAHRILPGMLPHGNMRPAGAGGARHSQGRAQDEGRGQQ